MHSFSYDPTLGHKENGIRHGEHFRKEIKTLVEIRINLALDQGKFSDHQQLLTLAEQHLPLLRNVAPHLHDELIGIAAGASLSPAELVVLNHYTDLKDLDPQTLGLSSKAEAQPSDHCSSIALYDKDDGIVLGQTWDMHGSALPYVLKLNLPKIDDKPEAQLLSLTGCLGMAGMNEHGLGITINNLKSLDATLGLVWPALVRRTLEMSSLNAAKDLIWNAPLGSGHHYMLGDSTGIVSIETSGTRKEILMEGSPIVPFFHTNHCIGKDVAMVSSISPVSTTLDRFAWLTGYFSDQMNHSKEALWSAMASHEGHPRGICTHLANSTTPHAMLTCARIMCIPKTKTFIFQPGCLKDASEVHSHTFK